MGSGDIPGGTHLGDPLTRLNLLADLYLGACQVRIHRSHAITVGDRDGAAVTATRCYLAHHPGGDRIDGIPGVAVKIQT